MASHISLKNDKPDNLFLTILPRATQQAFLFLKDQRFLSLQEWYLAGGTALAVQHGNRQSVDLDFFTPKNFKETVLERKLLLTHHWKTTLRENGTLYGILLDAKASFIFYPFFQPSAERLRCGYIRMLYSRDIAVMKVIAISQRGRKRDFVDLYWYCIHNNDPLAQVIERACKQYPGQAQNISHILKSLVYFDDAENDPMPKLFFQANWRSIKLFFRQEVVKITKKLLGLK